MPQSGLFRVPAGSKPQFGLLRVSAGLEPQSGLLRRGGCKISKYFKSDFIYSNTFKGNFIGNTSSDARHSTFWVLDSRLVYSMRTTQLPPLGLPYMALPSLVRTSRLLG